MKKLTSDILLELHVPDFEAVKQFYGSIGYKVVWEKKPKDRDGYLVMRSNESVLNFYCGNDQVYDHTHFKKFPKDTPRGYGVEIVIPIDGIEEFYKNFQDQHQESIVEKLKTRFSRPDFRAVDPFGFYLRFVERYNWVDGRDTAGKSIG